MNETAKKAMAFIVSFILVFSIIFFWFAGASAAVPKKLTIQGRLDQSGSLADGNIAMVFNIYNVSTGGTALYTESHTGSNKVEVNNGFFKTTLGGLEALDLDFDVPYWLGITIESDSEISPRIELTSSSYALKAGGLVMDENLNVDGGTFFVDVSNNKVGIGTTSPDYELDVSGNVNATAYYGDGSNLTGISVGGCPPHAVGGCQSGWADCNGDGRGCDSDGCESDLDRNSTCGSCSITCGSHSSCGDGNCSCDPGWYDCNGDGTGSDADGCEGDLVPSCLVYYNSGYYTDDGVYEIDPDLAGGNDPFNVYCDMTTDGGGWTKYEPLTNWSVDSSIWTVSNTTITSSSCDGLITTGVDPGGNWLTSDDILESHDEYYLKIIVNTKGGGGGPNWIPGFIPNEKPDHHSDDYRAWGGTRDVGTWHVLFNKNTKTIKTYNSGWGLEGTNNFTEDTDTWYFWVCGWADTSPAFNVNYCFYYR